MSQDIAKEIAKKELKKLVDNFKEHIDSYKNSDYNESTLRIDYLNKFFTLLGWDVANNQNLPPSYREVITEDKVQIEGRAKAPDYSFRQASGKRLFFVEAKKPAVNISKHTDSAFQLRRYGWSADLPVSILTNFEYFSIYDCTIKPLDSDAVTKARLKIISYEEYLEEFDYIWDRFSKEAVLKDSLVSYFGAKKKKKGTASVDDDFLNSLDGWRIALAKDINNNNNNLDEDQLNFIVQQTIDRIIFLRIAEDRDVEDYGAIQKCLEDKNHYKNLYQIFIKADQKYNSGLFKQDELSAKVKISDSVISKFINGLYYPKSPYEFSVLPIEILGKAYEQFLGKKITLTNAGNIKIEDKPEVKKAGGVYYTPKYIVDYIVQNTVGKLCEGKTPEQVSQLKILDPASGSGSFLIGAYEYLLNWYKDYFTKNPNAYSKKKMIEIITPSSELTTKFKGKVLLENIYGVDIDANAVEVTKLSLLLKCMEGETKETVNAQRSLFQERLLPTLENNIKCGNSLIDFDIYTVLPDAGDDRKLRRKINAFNWKIEFAKIFKNNGFDIVIGNPPYVRQELLGDFKPYFKYKYKVFNGVADLYTYFFEQSVNLLKENGLFNIIVANKWFRAKYGTQLREWAYNQNIVEIIDFGDLQVFDKATTYPCLVKIKKSDPSQQFKFADLTKTKLVDLSKFHKTPLHLISKRDLDNVNGWKFSDEGSHNVFKKLLRNGITLDQYLSGGVYRGLLTGLNEAFVIDEEQKRQLLSQDPKVENLLKPFLEGKDVKRYSKPFKIQYVILIPKGFTNANRAKKDAWEWFSTKYKALAEYLLPFKLKAQKRCDQGDYWWELRACDFYDQFEKPKIIYPNICKRPEFTFDTKNIYTNQKCYIIPTNDKYLLGILNSKVMHFLFEITLPKLRGGFYEPNYAVFKNVPIKVPNIKNDAERFHKKTIEDSVNNILDLYSETKEGIKLNQSEIAFYEDKINMAVYELYMLNIDDIATIEGIIDND